MKGTCKLPIAVNLQLFQNKNVLLKIFSTSFPLPRPPLSPGPYHLLLGSCNNKHLQVFFVSLVLAHTRPSRESSRHQFCPILLCNTSGGSSLLVGLNWLALRALQTFPILPAFYFVHALPSNSLPPSLVFTEAVPQSNSKTILSLLH